MHRQVLPLVHEFVDLLAARLALGTGDVGGVQEGGPLKPDVDKGGLHPGQDAADAALVDSADQTAAFGAFDDDLLDHAVLHDRDPGFRRGHIDQYLFAHSVVPMSLSSCKFGSPAAASSAAVSNRGRPMTPE